MKSFATPPEPTSPITSEAGLAFEEIRYLKDQLCRLPEMARFSDEQVEIIYGIAYAMFNQGKLEIAHGLFQTLMIYRPTNPRILLAYGICCKKTLRFDAAISALSSAYFCDPEDLNPVMHLSECLAVVGKYTECQNVIDPLISFATIDEKYHTIKKRAQTLKEMLRSTQLLNRDDGK